MARSADDQLQKLGARRLEPCGLGDEFLGQTHAAFHAWSSNMLQKLIQSSGNHPASSNQAADSGSHTMKNLHASQSPQQADLHHPKVPGQPAQLQQLHLAPEDTHNRQELSTSQVINLLSSLWFACDWLAGRLSCHSYGCMLDFVVV